MTDADKIAALRKRLDSLVTEFTLLMPFLDGVYLESVRRARDAGRKTLEETA